MDAPTRDADAPAGMAPRSRGGLTTALGWTVVVLLVVLTGILAAALAGMLLVVSIWLTVAVPVVVLLLVVGVAAYARKG